MYMYLFEDELLILSFLLCSSNYYVLCSQVTG